MIPINYQPEPIDFESKVRKPGQAFLASCPHPKSKDWKANNYWKNISTSLYNAYDGVCAYTGEWFSRTTSNVSVDHFQPKSIAPHLAYEWENYRLTTQKANNNKSDYIIVDPFVIEVGWFILNIPSCLITAGENLTSSRQAMVNYTIEVLKLNSDEEYVERRYETIVDFMKGDISFAFLERRFPFVASELKRQRLNVVENLSEYFKFRS